MKIVRDSCFYDRFRVYEVVLDGKTVGEVRDGETWEFSVLNGQHYLSLKVGWCGSKVIQFSAAEGAELTFDAKSGLLGRAFRGALWRALFARSSWISLEQRSTSAANRSPIAPT